VKLITKRLTDAGYDCGLSGKLHIASAWNGREARVDDGYRVYHYSNSATQGVFQNANDYVEWLREMGKLDQVMDTSNFNPQRNTGTKYRENIPAEHRYDPDAIPTPLWSESDLEVQERLSDAMFQGKPTKPGPSQRRNKANYFGMIELIDENVGRLLEVLEETGQRNNTIIIYTSDHGEMLGDHGLNGKGCRFYEGAVRVPLIISRPDHYVEGVIAQGLTELTDLVPTIEAETGLEPAKTHGRSLVPILTGKANPGKNHEFVRCEYYDTLDMQAPHGTGHEETWATMYRDDRWKLVTYHGLEYGELYDLDADPEEFHNLWKEETVRDIKYDLMKRSFDATVRTIDIGPPLIGRYSRIQQQHTDRRRNRHEPTEYHTHRRPRCGRLAWVLRPELRIEPKYRQADLGGGHLRPQYRGVPHLRTEQAGLFHRQVSPQHERVRKYKLRAEEHERWNGWRTGSHGPGAP